MGCTFAVPFLWSFRGLTRSYTCTQPAESITCPHVTSTHTDADFFSITCLDEDNSCMMQSHWVFWESLGMILPVVKSHIPGHGKVPNCSYFRAKWPARFCATFWYWHWYCDRVIWGLMLQLRIGMRQTWIFPSSVRSIPSVNVEARLFCCSSECVSHLLSYISLSISKTVCIQQHCLSLWSLLSSTCCPELPQQIISCKLM